MAAVVARPPPLPSSTTLPKPAASEVEMVGDKQATSTPTPAPVVEDFRAQPDDASSSELSDLEDFDDIGDIEPDHYYGGGKIPVFKPTMDQFRSFKKFINKIDRFGMKSGIVKVVPPKEWRDALPPLDERIKGIRVKNPITQEFEGTQGTYVQKNMEKQRSYNLPQWRELSEASNHQPPARRGERRRNQDKPVRSTPRTSAAGAPTAKKRAMGKGRRTFKSEDAAAQTDPTGGLADEVGADRPLTPTSPAADFKPDAEQPKSSAKKDARGRQPKSVSSRRKHNRREAADVIDEAAFVDFDYRVTDQDDFTPERCEELERSYWKSITYNSPMYGADMPGSLFDDSTKDWNVAKLENLLDVLGQKIPGVNTAYLYLGMWKSTFAWHLEDVDLYSINYIHFGAPKQWYSISQEDARRFEAAMRDVWPIPAKACSQFLRHKTFLISPSLLQSKYNIRVNRLVHHEGEFVITFPYGYHSGYNIGYNCAESVNFATESWLDYGRVAKKCNCEADSVWVDVNDIERKLRGEETEVEETEDDEDEDEDEDDRDDGARDLPTPPESVEGKSKKRSHKRKREVDGSDPILKVKRIRIRPKVPPREPCVLCPNDIPSERLLPTDEGTEAHRLCAIYTPETYVDGTAGSERIRNVASIDKARLELKCNYCRSKRGACFQCSQKKCTRAYHPTCAAAAGVLVDMRDVPVFDADGTEYTDVGIDFRCKFHRPKRSKNLDGDSLEENELVRENARGLAIGDVAQMQFYRGEIFAGVVVENRKSEQTIVVDTLLTGPRIEVEYRWVLALDPADSHLPVPSANAQPLSAHTAQRMRDTLSRPNPGRPSEGDPFGDPKSQHVWSEFHTTRMPRNREQAPVDMSKPDGLWYYLGKESTEARAQFSEDPRKRQHNPKSTFLNFVKPQISFGGPTQRRSYPATQAAGQTPRPLQAQASHSGSQASRPLQAQTSHSRIQAPLPPKAQATESGSRPPLPQQVQATNPASQTPRPLQAQGAAPVTPQHLSDFKPYQYKPRVKAEAGVRAPSFQQHANGKIAYSGMPARDLNHRPQAQAETKATEATSVSQTPLVNGEGPAPRAPTANMGVQGQVATQQAVIQQSGPQNGVSRQATPQQAAPQQAAPQQAAPQHVAPQQALRQPVESQQAAPQQFAPLPASPRQVASHEMAPDPAAPHQPVPHLALPQQAIARQAMPQQATPQQATPQPATPQQATPQPVTPQQATPQQAIHRQAIPLQAGPQQFAPKRASPQQSSPQQVSSQPGPAPVAPPAAVGSQATNPHMSPPAPRALTTAAQPRQDMPLHTGLTPKGVAHTHPQMSPQPQSFTLAEVAGAASTVATGVDQHQELLHQQPAVLPPATATQQQEPPKQRRHHLPPARASTPLDVLSKSYPFLLHLSSRRPEGPYQSPYLSGGGFSEAFLPLARGKDRKDEQKREHLEGQGRGQEQSGGHWKGKGIGGAAERMGVAVQAAVAVAGL
ncbi:MAG: hypothetical protein M1832_005093 [Thelocarpon impressellum]|nr:MAG: hypothetical protein M1832_005093 [Thelocarpon impressellum]